MDDEKLLDAKVIADKAMARVRAQSPQHARPFSPAAEAFFAELCDAINVHLEDIRQDARDNHGSCTARLAELERRMALQ